MTRPFKLRNAMNGRGAPPPGGWAHVTVDGRPSARVACPMCGFEAPLAGTHAIDADGTVTPSLVCGNEACAFHATVVLIGWSPAGVRA